MSKNIGVNLYDFGLDKAFLDRTIKAHTQKRKSDTLEYIKVKKNFVFQRTPSRKWKDSLENRRNICKSQIT